MNVTLTIPLETPSKKNSRVFLKNGRNIPSKKFRDWEINARLFLLTQKNNFPKKTIEEEITIHLTFVHGDLKRRDSDNQVSSILDLLQDVEILADDRWSIVKRIIVDNDYEKNNAHCKINIFDYIK